MGLKWAGTFAAGLVLVAFLFSTRRTIAWNGPRVEFAAGLRHGAAYAIWRAPRAANAPYGGVPGCQYLRYAGPPNLLWLPRGTGPGALRWLPGFGARSGWGPAAPAGWDGLALPLWIIFGAVALPTALLWYIQRRPTTQRIAGAADWISRRRRRVTVWLWLVWSGLHAAGSIVAARAVAAVYVFFTDVQADDGVLAALGALTFVGVWFAPVFAVLWAHAYAGMLNALRRRRHPALCTGCDYDLRGTPSGRCPECGRTASRGSGRGRQSGRTLRLLSQLGAAGTATLLATGVASLAWCCGWDGYRAYLRLGAGALSFSTVPNRAPRGWYFEQSARPMHWGWHVERVPAAGFRTPLPPPGSGMPVLVIDVYWRGWVGLGTPLLAVALLTAVLAGQSQAYSRRGRERDAEFGPPGS